MMNETTEEKKKEWFDLIPDEKKEDVIYGVNRETGFELLDLQDIHYLNLLDSEDLRSANYIQMIHATLKRDGRALVLGDASKVSDETAIMVVEEKKKEPLLEEQLFFIDERGRSAFIKKVNRKEVYAVHHEKDGVIRQRRNAVHWYNLGNAEEHLKTLANRFGWKRGG